MAGPLAGIRILEFEGIGPAPYAGMLLADLGADVLRVTRPSAERGPLIEDTGGAVMHRGRPALTLDLKNPGDLARVKPFIGQADALIEGLRPGAMERLGLGPEAVQALNPRLTYCRITGWGQEGPLARSAGHDINYIALAGVLGCIGPADRPPPPPLNLVGDFGGGGLWAAFGILAGVIEAARTGRGRVIDAAMLDGAASQMALVYAWMAGGAWAGERGANLLDGAAPFYRAYACADGKYVAVGAIEPVFFAALIEGLGLAGEGWDQADRGQWPELAARFAAVFATRPRDDWARLFEGTNACVTPVLGPEEAPAHPHNRARGTFTGPPDQPAPGPRFQGVDRASPRAIAEISAAWGLDPAELAGAE